MNQEPLTLYKLIVLYLLNKVSFPLTMAQVSDLILEKEFSTLKSFTSDLIRMQKNKKLELIDLSNASNDDIT